MNTPTMLYRCPGSEDCGGVMCQTQIVDEADVPAQVEAGWHTHFLDAKAAHDSATEQLQSNEEEQREIERKLAEAGAGSEANDLVGDEPAADAQAKAGPQADAEVKADPAVKATSKSKAKAS